MRGLLLLFLLFLFLTLVIVVSFQHLLYSVSSKFVSGYMICELFVRLIQVVHCGVSKRQRSDELADVQRSDLKLVLSVLCQNVFACLLNGTCRVPDRNMCKSAEREIWFNLSFAFLNECFPHLSSCRIIGEREINMLIKK